MKNLFIALLAVFVMNATANTAVAQTKNPCTALSKADRTACEVVKFNAGRDTSAGKIGRKADYCDTVLRREGEPLVFRWTRGKNAWAKNSKPLHGLVWAGKNKAGERFRKFGMKFNDGITIVETELCVDRRVWRSALSAAGISRDDIASGKVTIFLCGGKWAHRIPKERILAIMDGTPSRGIYSVLSRSETEKIAGILTKKGY